MSKSVEANFWHFLTWPLSAVFFLRSADFGKWKTGIRGRPAGRPLFVLPTLVNLSCRVPLPVGVRRIFLMFGSSQTCFFKPGCWQFLRGSALLRPFTFFVLLQTCVCVLAHSFAFFAFICVFLRPTALRTTALGNADMFMCLFLSWPGTISASPRHGPVCRRNGSRLSWTPCRPYF